MGAETPRRPVLFAYDGSRGARHAIEVAAGLFGPRSAVVLHVAEPSAPAFVPAAGVGAPIPVQLPAEVEQSLEERADEAARAIAGEGVDLAESVGFRAQPHIATAHGASSIAHAVCEAAEEHDACVVILGSHGRTGVKAALLGSVANAVVHGTRRPTMTIPEER